MMSFETKIISFHFPGITEFTVPGLPVQAWRQNQDVRTFDPAFVVLIFCQVFVLLYIWFALTFFCLMCEKVAV